MRWLPTLAVLAGCAAEPPAPDPNALPNAVVRIERLAGEMLAAIDEGRPRDADEPLHRVGPALLRAKKAAAERLLPTESAAVDAAIEQLLGGFAALHEPMHLNEWPADFDAAPIAADLRDGLEALRKALPKRVRARVEGAAERRDAPAATPPDEESGADRRRRSPFALASHARPRPASICPAVMIYDAFTRRHASDHLAKAAAIIGAEAPAAARWVQLVPTVHVRLNEDLTVDAYGVQRSRGASWTAPSNFEPMSLGLAERLRSAVDAAVEHAVANDLHLAVLPHLDPAGGPIDEWRNLYNVSPREEVGGYSFESLLLDAVAGAVERHARPTTRVDFCLSGEMGEALFRYPEEHLRVLNDLRRRFAAGGGTAGVRLGVGLNWSGVAGRVEADAFDADAVRAFFAACDFVGYSCYAPVSESPSAADFEQATDDFLAELRSLGVAPPASTPLVLTEVGVGGGEAGATPADVAREPWVGRGHGPLRPWNDPGLARFRRRYYAALCDYLASPAAARVERVYLWSEGPWDPQGVMNTLHRDAEIADRIARHNAGG